MESKFIMLYVFDVIVGLVIGTILKKIIPPKRVLETILGRIVYIAAFSAVTIFFFLNCDTSTSLSEKIIGTWKSTEQKGETESEIILQINDDYSYKMTGNLNTEIACWEMLTERGTWEQKGRTLVFHPEECKKLNFDSGILQLYDCGGGSKLLIKDTTLTDEKTEFQKVVDKISR